jgi:hypothetical protein
MRLALVVAVVMPMLSILMVITTVSLAISTHHRKERRCRM